MRAVGGAIDSIERAAVDSCVLSGAQEMLAHLRSPPTSQEEVPATDISEDRGGDPPLLRDAVIRALQRHSHHRGAHSFPRCLRIALLRQFAARRRQAPQGNVLDQGLLH